VRISKSYSFDASHILPRHPGKCGRLHGHTYEVLIGLESEVNKETQFVLDYNELDNIVKPLIERWDHQHLNLFIAYPSAENIATRIAFEFRHLLMSMNNVKGFKKLIVYISETPKTTAIWRSEDVADFRRLSSEADVEWKEPIVFNQVELDVENYFRKFQVIGGAKNAVIS
jgi:6-pyruvoyltetrahydropterin/6-carboxytetrahydropterin synthase